MPDRAIPNLLDDIAAKASDIARSDAAAAGPHWGAMYKLLLKAKVDPHEIARLVASRDVAGLDRVVKRLRGEEVPPAETTAAAAASTVDADTMRHALRAFRNRLKVTRLDAESKLSQRALSSGRKHDIDAIIPPRDYPHEVWEALAAAGKLRRLDDGFYALVDDHGNAER